MGHSHHGILLSNGKKWAFNTLNTWWYCNRIILSENKPVSKGYGLHTIWFHLYNTFRMTKLRDGKQKNNCQRLVMGKGIFAEVEQCGVFFVVVVVVVFVFVFFFCFQLASWLAASVPIRDWTWSPEVKALSPNHWTTRDFPTILSLDCSDVYTNQHMW